MSPQEKAEELTKKFLPLVRCPSMLLWKTYAKDCALISVDEILKYLADDGYPPEVKYWQQVKEELLKQ